MHDRFKRKMLKVYKREKVYIIEKIVKDLDEFVLFLVIYYNFISLMNINTTFLSMNINNSLINIANELIIINEVNYN